MTLQELGIISGLKPIGGWRYPQPFGSGIHIIKPEHAPKGHYANYGDKLVSAVQLFRRQHGIAEGDPARDVAEFIRRASPANDFYRGKSPEVISRPRIRKKTPLIEVIRDWIRSLALDKPALTNPVQAAERSAICAQCPHNVKWKINCSECVEVVEYEGNLLRAMTSFDFDPALLACRLHSMYLPAAVFLDRDFHPERSPEAPAKCWVKDGLTTNEKNE